MQPLGARGKAGHPTDGHILRSRNWPFDPFIFCPQPLRPKYFPADHTKGKRWILQDWSASGELSRVFLAASSFGEKDRNPGRLETLRWGDAGIHLVTSLATWGGLLTRLVKGFFLEA